jgi:membrane protease YdiL (CAAX protease family)
LIEETHQEPFWTWADLFLFLGLGLPAFVVTFLVAQFAIAPVTQNKAVLLMIPQFLAQMAMLIPIALLFRWKYDMAFLPAMRLGVRPGEIWPSFGSGIVLAVAVLALAALMRVPDIASPMRDLMQDPAAARWIAVFAVSVGPAFEEVFFRGLLQPVAVRTLGIITGILLSAAPFAVLHGPQYAWSWRHVLMILIAGSAFGWWRMRTRSTGAAIIMHSGYNTVLVVGYLIGRSAL